MHLPRFEVNLLVVQACYWKCGLPHYHQVYSILLQSLTRAPLPEMLKQESVVVLLISWSDLSTLLCRNFFRESICEAGSFHETEIEGYLYTIRASFYRPFLLEVQELSIL